MTVHSWSKNDVLWKHTEREKVVLKYKKGSRSEKLSERTGGWSERIPQILDENDKYMLVERQ